MLQDQTNLIKISTLEKEFLSNNDQGSIDKENSNSYKQEHSFPQYNLITQEYCTNSFKQQYDVRDNQKDQFKSLTLQISELQSQNQILQESLQDKQQQCQLFEAQFNEIKTAAQLIEKNNLNLQQEIQQLKEQLQQQPDAYQLNKIKNQYEVELTKKQDLYQHLHNQMMDIKKQNNYLFEQLKLYADDEKSYDKRFQEQIHHVSQQLTEEFQQQQQQLYNEIDSKNDIINELEDHLEKINNQLNSVYQENLQLQQEYSNVQQSYEDQFNQIIQDYEAQIKQIRIDTQLQNNQRRMRANSHHLKLNQSPDRSTRNQSILSALKNNFDRSINQSYNNSFLNKNYNEVESSCYEMIDSQEDSSQPLKQCIIKTSKFILQLLFMKWKN